MTAPHGDLALTRSSPEGSASGRVRTVPPSYPAARLHQPSRRIAATPILAYFGPLSRRGISGRHSGQPKYSRWRKERPQ